MVRGTVFHGTPYSFVWIGQKKQLHTFSLSLLFAKKGIKMKLMLFSVKWLVFVPRNEASSCMVQYMKLKTIYIIIFCFRDHKSQNLIFVAGWRVFFLAIG